MNKKAFIAHFLPRELIVLYAFFCDLHWEKLERKAYTHVAAISNRRDDDNTLGEINIC